MGAMQSLRPALVVFAALTLLTGVAYPALVTGIAQVTFPAAAAGSLVRSDAGEVRGSRLLAQAFEDPGAFWPRPSAVDYNAAGSGGSNLGPRSAALRERTEEAVAALKASAPVPAELVTTSGSGLDPHLSPAAARFQAPRVAAARGVPVERVLALIEERTEARQLGFLGEPTVNVLDLNLALEALR